MPIQIANPNVVAKIERLSEALGLTKTSAVEKAVEALLAAQGIGTGPATMARLSAILDQLDQIPDQPNPFATVEWDPHGMPR